MVELAVKRTNLTGIAASVHYARAGGSATPGVDFALQPGVLTFAPGQTRATIPVTIIDDAVSELSETIVVRLTGPGAKTSTGCAFSITLTIGPSDGRPDALISTSPGTGFVGDNVYSRTGAGQTVQTTAERGASRSFWVHVCNDGNARVGFVLAGTAPPPGSTVRYYRHGRDITHRMTSTHDIVRVASKPGRCAWALRIRITISASAHIGTVKSAGIAATWPGHWPGDGARSDMVVGRVRVVRSQREPRAGYGPEAMSRATDGAQYPA